MNAYLVLDGDLVEVAMMSSQEPDSGPAEISESADPNALDMLCYGIKCHHHLDCQRYMALEGDSSNLPRIATCLEVRGGALTYPLFLAKP